MDAIFARNDFLFLTLSTLCSLVLNSLTINAQVIISVFCLSVQNSSLYSCVLPIFLETKGGITLTYPLDNKHFSHCEQYTSQAFGFYQKDHICPKILYLTRLKTKKYKSSRYFIFNLIFFCSIIHKSLCRDCTVLIIMADILGKIFW